MSLSLQARRTLLTDTTHTSRHRNDTLMCYGLIPDEDSSNDEVDDPWTIIDNDPMDPIFYSTCYRQGTAWEFVSNPACPACEAANASSVPW